MTALWLSPPTGACIERWTRSTDRFQRSNTIPEAPIARRRCRTAPFIGRAGPIRGRYARSGLAPRISERARYATSFSRRSLIESHLSRHVAGFRIAVASVVLLCSEATMTVKGMAAHLVWRFCFPQCCRLQ